MRGCAKAIDLRSWRIAATLALAGLSYSVAHAGFGFKLDGTLDKEAISHAYFEGEFDRVRFPFEVSPLHRTSYAALFISRSAGLR